MEVRKQSPDSDLSGLIRLTKGLPRLRDYEH